MLPGYFQFGYYIFATDGTPAAPSGVLVQGGLSSVYCTDEDVARRAWGDYAALCPPGQKLAAGTDGVFYADDRWTLASASADFLAQGVAAGNVVRLSQAQGAGSAFAPGGELFAVASVATGQVTLRRLGQAAGVGQPPAPAAGLTGVVFSVPTFGPQVDVASYDANQFFGIDANILAKSPARLYDQRELQSYTVLTVLKRAYAIEVKQKAEDYALKLQQVAAELEELRSRLVLRWGPLGQGDMPTTAFGARVRR